MDFSWERTWRPTIKAAIIAFISTYGASNLVAFASGSAPFDQALARSAAITAVIVVGTALWHIVLDPSSIPSLAAKKAE